MWALDSRWLLFTPEPIPGPIPNSTFVQLSTLSVSDVAGVLLANTAKLTSTKTVKKSPSISSKDLLYYLKMIMKLWMHH